MIAPVEKVKLHVLGIKRFVLNSIVPQQTISNITRFFFFEGGGGGGGGGAGGEHVSQSVGRWTLKV